MSIYSSNIVSCELKRKDILNLNFLFLNLLFIFALQLWKIQTYKCVVFNQHNAALLKKKKKEARKLNRIYIK